LILHGRRENPSSRGRQGGFVRDYVRDPEKDFVTASQALTNAEQSLLRDESCGASLHLLPEERMFLS
jgi:hypothetical protein